MVMLSLITCLLTLTMLQGLLNSFVMEENTFLECTAQIGQHVKVIEQKLINILQYLLANFRNFE